MKTEEMLKLPPKEFAERSYKAFKDGRITAKQLKELSEYYLRKNNLWREK